MWLLRYSVKILSDVSCPYVQSQNSGEREELEVSSLALFCVVSLILKWALVKSFPVSGKAKPSQKPVQKPFPGWFSGCITTMVIQVTKSCSYARINFWMPGYGLGRGRSFSFKWEWWFWLKVSQGSEFSSDTRNSSWDYISELTGRSFFPLLTGWQSSYGKTFTLPLSLPALSFSFLFPFPLPFSLFPSPRVTLCCWQQGTAPALCHREVHGVDTKLCWSRVWLGGCKKQVKNWNELFLPVPLSPICPQII